MEQAKVQEQSQRFAPSLRKTEPKKLLGSWENGTTAGMHALAGRSGTSQG